MHVITVIAYLARLALIIKAGHGAYENLMMNNIFWGLWWTGVIILAAWFHGQWSRRDGSVVIF